MNEEGGISGYKDAEIRDRDAFIDIPCDIFVPAAQPDVITAENVEKLQCKMILQGANIPATPEAEQIIADMGILSVPDFVANAGGVICGSVEYHGGTKSQAFLEIEEKMRENTKLVLTKARDEKLSTRDAALELAKVRVAEAMSYRRAN